MTKDYVQVNVSAGTGTQTFQSVRAQRSLPPLTRLCRLLKQRVLETAGRIGRRPVFLLASFGACRAVAARRRVFSG
jgi:hypothetical protein